ncbi:MAG: hypothetical protein GX554_00700 [Elusimicrobia bacterium]|jgi:vacuolar-type H+-ATPase subunit F/Vma7|nr:hypothetical protein [Elusimicrobiota bacterium]
MEREKKIAFIGRQASIEFFSVFGAEMFPVLDQQQAYEVIEKLNVADYSVIFMAEEVFDSEKFHRYVMEKKLVVIPSLESKEGKGYRILDELIKKAIGMKG